MPPPRMPRIEGSPPDVTVVIPTRDRPHHIARAVRSLLAQELGPVRLEIVVVDNGRVGGTQAIVPAIASHGDQPVRCVHEPRAGVSFARNAGILHARAPVVAFCDDDQEVAPDWVRVIHDTFLAHANLDVIGGCVRPVWSSPPPSWLRGRELAGAVSALDGGPEPIRISRSRWMCLGAGNMAARRAVLERVGGFDPVYPRSQDRELLVRLLLAGSDVMYVPSMVVYHHVDGRRVTRSAFRRWFTTEGRMRAGYAFDELFLTSPIMEPLPPMAPRLLGVAPAMYRRLARDASRAAARALTGRLEEAFVHELRARYAWSYIRRRQQMHGHTSGVRPALIDVAAFVSRKLARRPVPERRSTLPL